MTYVADRCRVQSIDAVRLPGGTPVHVRPTLAQDLELQREFFRSLSPQRRYFRFMTGFQELPEGLAERFANVDHSSHFALLAGVYHAGREIMVGEARYVIDEVDPAVCEFALAVADDWTFKGLASALLERLERRAEACGIRRMRAETLVCNRAMIGLAMRAGYTVKSDAQDPTLARLEKLLPSSGSAAALAA